MTTTTAFEDSVLRILREAIKAASGNAYPHLVEQEFRRYRPRMLVALRYRRFSRNGMERRAE